MKQMLRKMTLLSIAAAIVFLACESQHFTGAKVYIQQSNWEKAIEQLKIETGMNPANAEAWWLLAECYAKTKKFTDMNHALNECVKADPTPTRKENVQNLRHNEWVPYYNSAVAALQKKDFAASIEKINKAIEVNADKPENYVNLGIIYIQMDSLDLAMPHFDKALGMLTPPKTKSDSTLYLTALKDKAAIYMNKKDNENSLKTYQQVVEFAPTDALAWISIGNCYDLNKDYENSQKAYSKASELEPDNKNIWYNIGVSFFQVKNHPEAIKAFEKVVAIDPDDKDALYNLSMLFTLEKQWDNALPHLEKLKVIDPDNKDIWQLLGTVYVNKNMKDEGAKAFDRAKELENQTN
ncbi:MAG: tetratricopeptide repeat protein [Candidatus Delongbacteria bacterium]|nr:tetratricopeptide repeat protein [Candidatus Delongbacteria bacterium]